MTKEQDIALLKRLLYEENSFLNYDPVLKAIARLVLELIEEKN
jgi:hypothetical protein